MLLAGFLTVFMYALSIISFNFLITKIFSTIYFISIDWLLFYVIYFILDFSDNRILVARNKFLTYIHSVLIILAASDSLSLMLNYFVHHAFDNVLLFDDISNIFYWNYNFYKGYSFHLLVCYILVFIITALFLYAIIHVKGEQKKRFIYFFSSFLLIIVSNVFYLIQQWTYDYSVLLYGLMTIFICYFSISQREKSKIKCLIDVYSKNIESAVLGFDFEKNCIFISPNTYNIFESEEQIQEIAKNYLKSDWFKPVMSSNSDYISFDDSFIINNQTYYFFVEYKVIRDKRNNEVGSYLNFTDKTEEIIELNNKKIILTHDKLTNLLNAETFKQRAEEIFNIDPSVERLLIVTNIKDFKFINDVFGSVIGDKILLEEAKILSSMNYKDCIQTRLYADQFALLINREHFNQKEFIEKLDSIQNITKSLNYKIIVNIGIYEIEDTEDDVRTMIDKAMIVIEQINLNNKTHIAYFNSEMMKRILKQKEFLSNFYNYFENKEFEVFYKPLYSDRKKITGYEACVKWVKSDKEVLAQEDFLPYINNSVLIGILDEYIWKNAFEYLQTLKNNNKNILIYIKLYEMDFYYTDLLKSLVDLVKEYGIKSSSICLEINENYILDKPSNLTVIHSLHREGFKIIIDNFGEGYSSFYMFDELNPDAIKLDLKSLKLGNEDKKENLIIHSMLNLSEIIDTKLIVNGVNTKEDFDFLKKIKCKSFQGSYFSEEKEPDL